MDTQINQFYSHTLQTNEYDSKRSPLNCEEKNRKKVDKIEESSTKSEMKLETAVPFLCYGKRL